MNEKTPNKKISRDKILNILNKIQKGRNQINFDSEIPNSSNISVKSM